MNSGLDTVKEQVSELKVVLGDTPPPAAPQGSPEDKKIKSTTYREDPLKTEV